MLTKIFTTISAYCPFGKGCAIDSTECRKCEYFYRVGTATFFWCKHPDAQKPAEIAHETPKIARKPAKLVQETKKRGRPAKKAISKPVKRRKTKK